MQSQVAEGGVRSLSTMKGLVEKRTLVQSPSFRRDPLLPSEMPNTNQYQVL